MGKTLTHAEGVAMAGKAVAESVEQAINICFRDASDRMQAVLVNTIERHAGMQAYEAGLREIGGQLADIQRRLTLLEYTLETSRDLAAALNRGVR